MAAPAGDCYIQIESIRYLWLKTGAQTETQTAVLAARPIAVEFRLCSGGSSSNAATGSDPDRLPVAEFCDAPV